MRDGSRLLEISCIAPTNGDSQSVRDSLVPVFQGKFWATLDALEASRYHKMRAFHSPVNLGAARLNSIQQVFLIVLKALNKRMWLMALQEGTANPLCSESLLGLIF